MPLAPTCPRMCLSFGLFCRQPARVQLDNSARLDCRLGSCLEENINVHTLCPGRRRGVASDRGNPSFHGRTSFSLPHSLHERSHVCIMSAGMHDGELHADRGRIVLTTSWSWTAVTPHSLGSVMRASQAAAGSKLKQHERRETAHALATVHSRKQMSENPR